MTPTGTDRQMSFDIPPGVAVYGGFAGTEASLAQRDPAANPTILSGDIDGDDTDTDGNSIDEAATDIQGANSYHVVTMDGTGGTPITATSVLDGFSITGGHANGAYPDDSGGGLSCYGSGAGSKCSPSFTNATFTGNTAVSSGGAIFNDGASGTSNPSFTNVILWGDTAGASDPEIYNSSAAPTIDHSVVEGGCASIFGAICGGGNLDTDPVLGPLQDNGGPTETIALDAGSSAIDAADDGACPATDQRGVSRPQGAHCDSGAYELDTTGPTVESTSLATTYVTTGPSSFTVTFSEPVADPAGDSDPDDATNPANYLLVEAGGNATFDTLSCAGGVVSDDTQVPVAGVTYDGGTLTATVSLGASLPLGTYRLFVCGTTSITDLAGNKLNGGTDSTFDLAVLAITEVPALGPAGLALLALLLATGALALLHRG